MATQKIVRERDYTFMQDSYGGGKEELGEEEWVLLNTLSFRKTKIWQDYSTLLEPKRGEEMGFLCCVLEWRRWEVYIVVVEEIWIEGYLMRRRNGVFVLCLGMKEMRGLYSSGGGNMNRKLFNEGWQRIMNLNLILSLGEV